MKLWLVVLFLMLINVAAVQAYLEENTAGLARTSAGDQNTNLHKLSVLGKLKVRQLKDSEIKDAYQAGKIRADELGDLSQTMVTAPDLAAKQLDKLQKTVAAKTQNPAQLIKQNYNIYRELSAITAENIRDTQTAAALRQEVLGR